MKQLLASLFCNRSLSSHCNEYFAYRDSLSHPQVFASGLFPHIGEREQENSVVAAKRDVVCVIADISWLASHSAV
jgi:hypothetical protein